jgi:hypothetical protein
LPRPPAGALVCLALSRVVPTLALTRLPAMYRHARRPGGDPAFPAGTRLPLLLATFLARPTCHCGSFGHRPIVLARQARRCCQPCVPDGLARSETWSELTGDSQPLVEEQCKTYSDLCWPQNPYRASTPRSSACRVGAVLRGQIWGQLIFKHSGKSRLSRGLQRFSLPSSGTIFLLASRRPRVAYDEHLPLSVPTGVVNQPPWPSCGAITRCDRDALTGGAE